MFKSYIFASLYTVAGMTGWGAYSTISTEDTSINAIKQIASATVKNQQPSSISKNLYRWKDQHGVWQYGELPKNDINATYKKELQLLRSLPREVLPTQALKAAVKDDSIFDALPNLSGIRQFLSLKTDDNESQGSTLLEDAKKLKQMAKQREQALSNIGS